MLMEIQVKAPYFTNVPEDVITNVWHWVWDGGSDPTTGQCDSLKDALMGFYEAIFNSTTNAGLAPWVKATGWSIKMYDLAQPKPRVPYYTATDTFAGSSATTSAIAPEVALCVSYQADYINGVNPQSQRGRIYVGGIGTGVTNGTGSAFPVPGTTLINNACAAASTLAAGPIATNWHWVIWSRKLGVYWTVTKGWVDNAFDTQRRRGQKATARTLWT